MNEDSMEENVKNRSIWDKVKGFLHITGTAKGEYELKEFKQQLFILMIAIIIVLQIVGAWLFMREMGWIANGTPEKFDKNIAVLELNEEITENYINKIIGQIEKIKEKKEKFPHLFIIISSPGGSPQASSDFYFYLRDLQKEIPITVFVQNMAMSGAYYIACASEYDPKNKLSGIIANNNAPVGSIGVIMPKFVYTIAKGKIDEDDIAVGRHKKPISSFKFTSEEDKEYLKRNLLNPVYQHFLQTVSKGRQMDMNETIKYAEGQVWISTEVVGKLVDRISYVTKVKDEIKESVERRFPDEEVGFVPISLKKRDGGLFNVKVDIGGLVGTDLGAVVDGQVKYILN